MAIDWNDLKTFADVARLGSLSAAARATGVHQTTIARRLSAAEAALGAPLFLRSTRGLVLAPAGTRLAALLEPLVASVDDVVRAAADPARIPVRIAVTDNGARILAAYAIPKLDPAIEIELVAGNTVVDLARNEADLAVRVVAPDEPHLVRQRLGEVRYGLYASKDVARRWRDGGDGSAIAMPSGVLAQGPEARWLAEHARSARVAVRSANLLHLAVAAEHGAGACVLPTNLAAFHPRLVLIRALDDIAPRPVWLVAHRDARKEPRIRAVWQVVGDAMRAALAHS